MFGAVLDLVAALPAGAIEIVTEIPGGVWSAIGAGVGAFIGTHRRLARMVKVEVADQVPPAVSAELDRRASWDAAAAGDVRGVA